MIIEVNSACHCTFLCKVDYFAIDVRSLSTSRRLCQAQFTESDTIER